MRGVYIIFLVLIFLICACRKDKPPEIIAHPTYCYANSSTSDFDFTLKDVYYEDDDFPWGPTDFGLGAYHASNPIFNPNDANQMVYTKVDSGMFTENPEIWFYDFCTKESRTIADNFFYHLDWGVNDWLLYSGNSYNMFKVKSNGDSLTQLTFSEEPLTSAKWSPNASLFYTFSGIGLKIFDNNGISQKEEDGLLYFRPVAWIDQDHLLVLDKIDEVFQSYNWLTGEIITLQSEPQCFSCSKVYDLVNDHIYFVEIRSGRQHGLYRLTLSTGETVYLNELAGSFKYRSGDINANKDQFIFTLDRFEWKDSLALERYVKRDLILFDQNTKEQRIVELPH